MYLVGHGVRQDYGEALNGSFGPQIKVSPPPSLVGFAYRTGDYGVRQDYPQAIKWLRRAAEQGHDGRKATSGSPIATARACRKTTSRRTSGSTWPQLKQTPGERVLPETRDSLPRK